jgi:hypothetical protein
MSKRKPQKIKFNLEKIFKKKKSKAATYLLEKGTLAEMRAAKEWTAKQLDFHWRFYSELAYQRNKNLEALKEAILMQSTSNFEFKNWPMKFMPTNHSWLNLNSCCWIQS